MSDYDCALSQLTNNKAVVFPHDNRSSQIGVIESIPMFQIYIFFKLLINQRNNYRRVRKNWIV